MQFNPQMLLQVMMKNNPNMMQQFNQFKQMMQNNSQMQQQYMNFKNEAMNNPQKYYDEAMRKVGMYPPHNNG